MLTRMIPTRAVANCASRPFRPVRRPDPHPIALGQAQRQQAGGQLIDPVREFPERPAIAGCLEDRRGAIAVPSDDLGHEIRDRRLQQRTVRGPDDMGQAVDRPGGKRCGVHRALRWDLVCGKFCGIAKVVARGAGFAPAVGRRTPGHPGGQGPLAVRSGGPSAPVTDQRSAPSPRTRAGSAPAIFIDFHRAVDTVS